MKVHSLLACFIIITLTPFTVTFAQNTIFPLNVGIGPFGQGSPYLAPLTPLHIVAPWPQIRLTGLNLLGEGDLGLYAGLSAFETPNDFVVRSGGHGEDLILTNINALGAIRFGTSETDPNGGPPLDQERMTITDQGLIGVNNTTPDDLLHLSDQVSSNPRVAIQLSSSTTDAVGQLGLARQNGDYADFAQVNDLVLRTSYKATGPMRSDLILTAQNPEGSIRFGTVENGLTGDIERMVIHNNGNVGIGIAAQDPLSKLHVGGAEKLW